MSLKFIKFTVIILLITSCGYKIVDEKISLDINNIVTSGDRKINYIIKNKLSSISDKGSKKQVKLTINSKKTKTIKEKNVRNQITKYRIKIVTEIKLMNTLNSNTKEFYVLKEGDYNVGDKHSDTITNEKKLVEIMTASISEKIIERLVNFKNDI
jgi:hypothetical protein